jgi:hypothetical protein
MSPVGSLGNPLGLFLPRSFCGLVLVIIALQALAKVAAGMGLFADGSYFLLRVLAYPQIPDADPWRRWLAHVVWEAPLLLVLGAGLQRINLIIYFYSFCLVAIPAALWILSLWKLRLSPFFWPFLMIFSIVHLNCDLFAIGEYNLASAIAALDMAILLQPAPLIAGDAVLLVASSVFTVNTYESFVFLGPLLAGTAIARMVSTRSYGSFGFPIRGPSVADARMVSANRYDGEVGWLCTAMFFFVCATARSGWAIAFPYDAEMRADAANIRSHLYNFQLVISIAVGILYAVQLYFGQRTSSASRLICMIALTTGLGLPLLLVHPATWASAEQYYGSRALCSGVLFVGLAAVAIWHFRTHAYHDEAVISPVKMPRSVWAMPVLVFGALLVPNLTHALGFYNFLRTFHNQVASRTGFVPIEATPLLDGEYDWAWTNPSLCLLLRDNPGQAIILNPSSYQGWEAFDPRKSMPDLSRYRLNASSLFFR